jgi:predicted CoA-substrate-specific enzyme activase
MQKCYRIGLDVGSTTAKVVVVDEKNDVVYSSYQRHNADINNAVINILNTIEQQFKDINVSIMLSGSAGMGLAERCDLNFIQEVVALSNYAKNINSSLHSIIDIGGEDAKIIFLEDNHVPDMRMNGNCAGGTGAFIDQMSIILGLTIPEMDSLAQKSNILYPIASRCGVFSKTDVQNLVAKNIPLEDICASIFHAIAVQVVSSLSRGKEIMPKVLFAGGPLTFIQSLRKSFIDYLQIKQEDILCDKESNLLVAFGCVCDNDLTQKYFPLSELINKIQSLNKKVVYQNNDSLMPIFDSEKEYKQWQEDKNTYCNIKPITNYKDKAFIGIDSGSTTTKIVLCDKDENIIFSYYSKNQGDPINAVIKGLKELKDVCHKENAKPIIVGGCSTGYGEDLIKTAFGFNHSIVETIAHYKAARKILPEVDFILDIGGQDMKAMYIEDGVLNRIELNEACSSGCGSFIETFANSLGYKVSDFSHIALFAKNPCNLGTRCTVFMNSKVKQYLREGAGVENISAGLSYSVVKNCLYKVLKIKNTSIGNHIVVQGGTMKNDSIVKAFENMLNKKVFRSTNPELMGAYGCSLYAKEKKNEIVLDLDSMIEVNNYSTKQTICKGCENNCLISTYTFLNHQTFHSGNKCEKIFSSFHKTKPADNIFDYKQTRLFSQNILVNPQQIIGIPKVLNMYEDFPFWNTLFEKCNIQIELSDNSSYVSYEKSLNQIMSENICFPAKLVHSHIDNLINKGIKHIFFPYIVYENKEDDKANNSYNCPIVSSYNVVIKNLKENPKYSDVKIDNPVFTFKDKDLLYNNCKQYLLSLNVDKKLIDNAFEEAIQAKQQYVLDIKNKNIEYFNKAKQNKNIIILLSGRPYHTDSLIQHNLSSMIASLGVTVINEDITRDDNQIDTKESYIVSQWSYINRIVRSSEFVCKQDRDVNFVQMTSFGCGPDAFLLDEVSNIMKRYHRSATQIKIDDIQNVGSMKLRIRSLIESLKIKNNIRKTIIPFVDTKSFDIEDKNRTILAPFFTDYISPFLPALFKINGYNLKVLPKSNEESVEYGLQYSNNEVCYPATLIVGDVIKALRSGEYDTKNVAVGITQTGGQCRATNYYSIIRKALVDAGYSDVPVISVNFNGNTALSQKGFSLNWKKTLPLALSAILFGDCFSKMYYCAIVRFSDKTKLDDLQTQYFNKVNQAILNQDNNAIQKLLISAVDDFNALLPNEKIDKQRVGIVGEIFLKYHSFANHDVVKWLISQGIEVIPPTLITFFMQTFVNRQVNNKYDIEKTKIPQFVMNIVYRILKGRIKQYNNIMSKFKYFAPIEDVFNLSKFAKGIIPLYSQFGEGWLLPAEIASMATNGINKVISLQPFGCIANHIISKGVENKLKQKYPLLNYLSLDFDSGVSDVNVKNRLLLLLNE